MIHCSEAEEYAVQYACGNSLEAEDLRRLLEHLAVCRKCYEYLREVQEALQLLPYGLPEIEPPGELRERLLLRIRSEQRGSGHERTGAAYFLWKQVAVWGRRLLPAAAVLLVLITGRGAWLNHVENRRLLEEMHRTAQQMQAAATLLGELPEPVETVALRKEPAYPDAWGHLTLYDTRYGHVIVIAVGGLPPVSGDEVYRLWLLEDGRRIDGGGARPDESGFAAWMMQTDDFHWEAIGITREPDDRAVPGPRGPRVMFGQL